MSDFGADAFDALLADMEGLSVEPVVATPVPTSRGKSTSGGRTAKLTSLFRSSSEFQDAARFATEGSSPVECMGRIGSNGRRFCIIKGCTTKKHQSDKFEAPANHFFIKTSATQAYCAPTVDSAKLPLGHAVELMTISKSVEDWVNVFSVLQSSEEELSLDEVERKLEFLEQAKAHRTPAKAPRMSESAFHAKDLEDMLEEIPDEISKATAYDWSDSLPGEFVSAVEVLGRVVTSLAAAVPTALSESSLRVSETKRTMVSWHDQLNARLISLEGMVGEREDANDEVPPTVWDAVRILFERSSEEDTPSTMATAASSPNSFEAVGSGRRVFEVLDGLREQRARDVKLHAELSEKLSAHMRQAKSLFEALSKKVASVIKVQNESTREVNRLAATGGGKSYGGGTPDGLDDLMAELGGAPESEIEALRKEVRGLRKLLEQAQEEGGRELVEIAGLKFHNREELGAWLLENAPHPPVGAFVGFHGLMQQVHFDTKGYENMQSILKSLTLKSDMGLKTNGDALVLAAIRSAIPAVFGEGKPPTGEDRSAFHALHTFNDWKDANGRDGFINEFVGYKLQARDGIRMEAETRLEPGSAAAMLASTCLTKSENFSDAFIKFLTTTYEELTQASGFPKKRAWALTTSLGKRICQEVHKESGALARSLIVSKDEKERDQLCTMLVWATLREHMVMEDYIQKDFKDHTSVASEYVKFLATNSGLETVASLQSRVDVFDKDLATMKKSLSMMGNTVDGIKRMAEDAKKAAEKKRGPG